MAVDDFQIWVSQPILSAILQLIKSHLYTELLASLRGHLFPKWNNYINRFATDYLSPRNGGVPLHDSQYMLCLNVFPDPIVSKEQDYFEAQVNGLMYDKVSLKTYSSHEGIPLATRDLAG